jgi:hypothetical protein
MKHFAIYLVLFATTVLGQTSYKPTADELRHEELGRRMRSRQINPADFFKEAANTKIVFYGQVVDRDGVPIEGAKVTYCPSLGLASGGSDPRYELATGRAGFFTIKSSGVGLYIQVRKEGYRSVEIPPALPASDGPAGRGRRFGSTGSFDYFNGLGHPELNHHPEEDRPVQFVLRKVGTIEPLKITEGLWFFKPPTEALKVSLEGNSSTAHSIKVICRSDCKANVGSKDYSRFKWSFELHVQNGGVIEQLDDGYEAPKSDYKPSLLLASMGESESRWMENFNEKKYYIRFDDGVCARIEISGGASYRRGENRPYVNVTSYLNPNPKSRNLETPPGR